MIGTSTFICPSFLPPLIPSPHPHLRRHNFLVYCWLLLALVVHYYVCTSTYAATAADTVTVSATDVEDSKEENCIV